MSHEQCFWIWAEAAELLQGAARTRRRLLAVDRLNRIPCWEPPVDLYEQDGRLRLLVALPGVAPRQIEVILDADALVVRGERPKPGFGGHAAIHRLEIPYGRFERRVPLPVGEFQLENHVLEAGCLSIQLRRLT